MSGWTAVYVGAWLSLVLTLAIGVAALVSHRRNADPSDLTALFTADTAQFPREHSAQHRRPRSTRRWVCTPRLPVDQRDTVRVQTFDPPEGHRG